MRSICKKGSVIFVAVLALCVVASASASAAQFYVGGKTLTGSAALAGTAKVEESITLTMLKGSAKITCSSIELEGKKEGAANIVAPGSLEIGYIVLNGCKESVPTGCSIEEEITMARFGTQLATSTAPEDKVVLENLYTMLDFKGSTCSLAGEKPMEGNFTLLAPKGQEELAEQTFTGQGSNEKPAGTELFNDPVYLSGKFKIKLASGKAWSFH